MYKIVIDTERKTIRRKLLEVKEKFNGRYKNKIFFLFVQIQRIEIIVFENFN